MNPTHIIESAYLTEGLFGQIMTWCLEILPYIEKHNLKPEWHIYSRNYGVQPDYNIFPNILSINYEPDKHEGASEILSFSKIKNEEGHPNYNFQFNFELANHLFTKYFLLHTEITNAVDDYFSPYIGKHILGLHYRGTDKQDDTSQTNPVTADLMLRLAQDMLKKVPDIDLIFLATDEESFIAKASNELPIQVISFDQQRKAIQTSTEEWHEPLFRGHDENHNTEVGRCAIIDSLLLSRCHYLLKCQSSLSAWSKIWNPELEAYRIAAFKHDWFPDAFIPLYTADSSELNAELMNTQMGEVPTENKLRASLPVNSYFTK